MFNRIVDWLRGRATREEHAACLAELSQRWRSFYETSPYSRGQALDEQMATFLPDAELFMQNEYPRVYREIRDRPYAQICVAVEMSGSHSRAAVDEAVWALFSDRRATLRRIEGLERLAADLRRNPETRN